MDDPTIWPIMGRLLNDGRYLCVWPLTFGKAALCLGHEGDGGFYDDSWHYDSVLAAVMAAATWDGTGEPTGWFRHPHSGRRRPDGDPAKEYVQP